MHRHVQLRSIVAVMLMWLNIGECGLPSIVRIGKPNSLTHALKQKLSNCFGVFSATIFTDDQRNSSAELAFKYAVYRINKDKTILPSTTLIYDIQYVPKEDSFRTTKKVCRQIANEYDGVPGLGAGAAKPSRLGGVFAIFAPADTFLGTHVESICDALQIPCIQQRVDFHTALENAIKSKHSFIHRPPTKPFAMHNKPGYSQQRNANTNAAELMSPPTFSINLHPSQKYINQAYFDLINYLNWTRFAVLYENDYGLFKQQDFLKASTVRSAFANHEIYIRQTAPDTYRQVLRDIRQKEIFKLIVDTDSTNIKIFFRSVRRAKNIFVTLSISSN